MDRRDFLKFLRKPAIIAAAAVPVLSATANTKDPAVDKERRVTEALRGQVSALKERMDAMDKNYKKTIKAGIAVIAALVGIDISSAL